MKLTTGPLVCLGLIAALMSPAPLRADLVTYSNRDAGAGPGSAHPNTNAANASFTKAASAFGPVHLVDLGGISTSHPLDQNPTPLGNGVSVALINTDHKPPPGTSFGISIASISPVKDGFSTTTGGREFIEVVPSLPTTGLATSSVNFSFAKPISAFGFDLTGVGTAPGDLHLVFNDGKVRDIAIAGSAAGGAQFVGFTDLSLSIRAVSLQMRNVPTFARDAFGIDKIQFVSATAAVVPEPTTTLLMTLGLLGLAVSLRSGRSPFACRGMLRGGQRAGG